MKSLKEAFSKADESTPSVSQFSPISQEPIKGTMKDVISKASKVFNEKDTKYKPVSQDRIKQSCTELTSGVDSVSSDISIEMGN